MTDQDPKRRPPLPVEPLSEEAWARIEAKVHARLDDESALDAGRPRTRLYGRAGAAAAALAVAAAAVLAVLAGRQGHDAPRVAPPAEQVVATDVPRETRAGEARVTLAAHTALTVTGDDAQGHLVTLQQGRAAFVVPPRKGRAPFRVLAGDVQVEVVGTQFSVEMRGGDVEVQVREGIVAVHHDGQRHRVPAGEGFRTAALARRSPATPQAEDLRAQATRAALPQGVEQEQERHSRSTPAPRSDETGRTGPSRGAGAPAQRRAPEPSRSPQQRFEAAAALEASQPAQALETYLELAGGRGPWAVNALFAAARLELEQGHTQKGRALLQRYLRRHPEGPNAADARTLLKEESP